MIRRAVLVGLLIVVFAGSMVLWWRGRQEDREIASQYYIPKVAHTTPEIQLLQQYVRVDTSNPPGKELAGAQFLAAQLAKAGIKAEIIESAPGRASVYARIKGRVPNEGLMLLNHVDVVPASPDGWSHPPFAATIALNNMWGRGTLDMKSIGITELEAFVAVARNGRTPERDIVFLAEADEEQGGRYGLEWLIEHRPDIFAGIRYALNEGGITETQTEQIQYFGIEVGTKMRVHAKVHAATREQLERLRVALEPYMTPRDPDRVLPEVREFLHELAPHRVEQGQYLNDVTRTIAEGKFWLLQRPYKELMQNVVWVRGVHVENGAANVDVLLYNLPDEDPDARIAWLREFVKPFGGTVEIVEKTGPAPLSTRHTPLFALLTNQIRREYGNVPVGTEVLAASWNDSRFLRARGVTCYGLWPFPVDYYQSSGIHGIDERIRVDWFMNGVDLMRGVVRTYAFEPIAKW